MHTGFWWGRPEGKIHLKDLGVDGRVLMNPQEVGWGLMDWIDLTKDRDRWRVVVSAVMNLRVP
jgi:ribosomal protein S4E